MKKFLNPYVQRQAQINFLLKISTDNQEKSNKNL